MLKYLESLRMDHKKFFDLVETGRDGKPKYVASYFCGRDNETVKRGKKNYVLSEQDAVVSRDAVSLTIRLLNDRRKKLKEVVRDAVASVHGGIFPKSYRGEKIVFFMVAHFMLMEWSCLGDLNADYIKKRLSLIRKTVVTNGHPIKLKIDGCEVHAHFFDTYLLGPDKYKSLAALSGLLDVKGIRKLRIPTYYISRMDELLQRYPRLFKRYALMDSVLTVGLLFKLQVSLNEHVYGPGTIKKMFKTIASATTAAFVERNPWFAEYRDALDHQRFLPAFGLSKQAFHGGLNSNFFIGRSDDYDRHRQEIFFDLDFVSAYPSAAALCPLLDEDADPIITQITYRIDDAAMMKLRENNVPEKVITRIQEALHG